MTQNIYFDGPTLWSQIDANRHLRHSAYADFAAQARINLLNSIGLDDHIFAQYNLGPILFREELIYQREIRLGDRVQVTCELTKSRADGSRFSFRQEIYRGDGILSAIVNVDGAWIDLERRKLIALPNELNQKIALIPKSSDYEILPVSNKS
jgi:acyl-CoA thioester hydrolase